MQQVQWHTVVLSNGFCYLLKVLKQVMLWPE